MKLLVLACIMGLVTAILAVSQVKGLQRVNGKYLAVNFIYVELKVIQIPNKKIQIFENEFSKFSQFSKLWTTHAVRKIEKIKFSWSYLVISWSYHGHIKKLT